MILRTSFVWLIAAILIFSSCNSPAGNSKTRKSNSGKKHVTVPLFNADSAYAYVAKQVSFGPRVPGTEAHSACAKWLIKKAEEFADTVIVQPFRARTYDGVTRSGQNIIVSFNPDNSKRVLLMAHWDSRPFADHDKDKANYNKPIDAANDGASGVAVLLEMARQFKLQPPDAGVDIVFFDLEDWGPPAQLNMSNEDYWGLGSQYWSKTPHIPGYTASFGILLDMVGAKDPVYRKEYFSQQYARYVLDLVWNTASDMGYADIFQDEDGIATTDDHYFVNKYAKIPSIDIIHLETDDSRMSFYKHWHTVDDKLEYIDPETLRITGQVVMTVVYNE